MVRRGLGTAALGTGLCVVLALPLAGCRNLMEKPPKPDPAASAGAAGQGASPGPSPSVAPAAALAAAVTKTAGTSCKLQLGDSSSRGSGGYDAASKGTLYEVDVDDGSTVSVVSFGVDVYITGLPDGEGKTVHFDATKFDPHSSLLLVIDPMLALRLLTAAAAVERTPSGYHGTIDLTKVDATGYPADKVVLDGLVAKGDSQAAVRTFDVSVDDEGRITLFRTTFPNADGGEDDDYELTLSDFGTADTIGKPAADVVEATPGLYRDQPDQANG